MPNDASVGVEQRVASLEQAVAALEEKVAALVRWPLALADHLNRESAKDPG